MWIFSNVSHILISNVTFQMSSTLIFGMVLKYNDFYLFVFV